ncbi:MAG: molecular chaperone TorD family protein, partial [Eggerthellaceae bacterium]|nr:molecular chaperone TorD family protein [Eggerthellaceae bacterium]
ETLHAASVSFHNMFVGPHHVTCPPWGSVHMDGGRLFGPSSLEVVQVLEAHGFAIPEGKSEPSDHVAYELAFVSECLASGSPATAADFICKYLEPWFGKFAALVREHDVTGFYDGVCRLTSGLLGLTMALAEKTE